MLFRSWKGWQLDARLRSSGLALPVQLAERSTSIKVWNMLVSLAVPPLWWVSAVPHLQYWSTLPQSARALYLKWLRTALVLARFTGEVDLKLTVTFRRMHSTARRWYNTTGGQEAAVLSEEDAEVGSSWPNLSRRFMDDTRSREPDCLHGYGSAQWPSSATSLAMPSHSQFITMNQPDLVDTFQYWLAQDRRRVAGFG